ncbi:MAG: choice-of-anchor B family protein, partial [Chitinophagales bacterium]|nr:choice-of-anchor B family protein [Chitinophagales bacterium]
MKKVILFLSILFLVGNLSAQDFNMQFRSHVTYPGYTCSSEWGYVDALGNEYALVGTSFGVSIVDITDPDNPVVKFDVQHTPSFWREIKTYKNYAYATNEDGGGLLIMDLSQLPDTVYQSSFIYTDVNNYQQSDGHELWIDEKGRLYIIGGGYWNGGTTIFDLTADPLNPAFLGAYQNHYMHSAFVRGDTMWASEIFDGQVEVVNVANPAAPVLMASFNTPNNFTHNAWPTSDNHYLFTTDEVSGAFVASYDVSDLSNITELDRVQSFPGTSVIPHNVHLLNDEFAVTAYYCDGVVVFDVSRPKNMIKVASYDTWLNACNGYNGTWGAYPYLPSGNLILSNIEDGLYVLTPTYVPACWLEGIVTDSVTGVLLNNVSVEILNTDQTTLSNLSGEYKTGIGVPGNYTVKFTAAGYSTRNINVSLNSGLLTTLNVKMTVPTLVILTGTVIDSVTNFAIPNASVRFVDGLNQYVAAADGAGNFTISNFL